MNSKYIVNESDKVVAYRGENGRTYPYKYDKRMRCYTSIAGECSISAIKSRERRGTVIWK